MKKSIFHDKLLICFDSSFKANAAFEFTEAAHAHGGKALDRFEKIK